MTKIAVFSDVHEQWGALTDKLRALDCQLAISCGDISYRGALDKLYGFNQWCKYLKKQKIVEEIVSIAGNHELTLDPSSSLREEALDTIEDYIYLECSHVNLYGIRIWGSPWTPRFYDWAFQIDSESQARAIYDKIPLDSHILVTHGPPYGYGDVVSREHGEVHAGDKILLEYIEKIKPKFVLSGHLHEGFGIRQAPWGSTTIINASILNDNYKAVNEPIVIEI